VGAVKLRNARPIVVINGEKISRGVFMAELEKAHGATLLRRMMAEKLVLQEAKKKGVVPTPQQVQTEIAEMRQAEPDLDRQLRINGKTMEDLETDVQGRLAIANVVAAEVNLPEAEVKKLWATHQRKFNRPEGRKVAMVITKTAEIGAKARRLVTDGIPTEFASQNYGMALPRGRSQMVVYRGQLPPSFEQQVFSLKPGAVSSVLPVGNAFAVVKVLETVPAQQKRFEDVKDRLVLAAKVQRGKKEPELIQALQKSAKIEFKSDRYKGLADASLAVPDPRSTRVARAR
jgi:peptidyl-prolyl cis-trans isomerase C